MIFCFYSNLPKSCCPLPPRGGGGGWRGGGEARKANLGCIQSHAEAPGPVQLLSKGWAGASLPENIKQRPSSTELCDDAGRLHTHAHEHHHIWVPQTSHDGHLHKQTGTSRFCTMTKKGTTTTRTLHPAWLTSADKHLQNAMIIGKTIHNTVMTGTPCLMPAQTSTDAPIFVSTMIGVQNGQVKYWLKYRNRAIHRLNDNKPGILATTT